MNFIDSKKEIDAILKKYNANEAELKKLAKKYELYVEINDSKDYKKFMSALTELRTARTNIDKKRKALKAIPTQINRAIDDEARRLTALFQHEEDRLKSIKVEFDKKKEAEREAKKIQEEIDAVYDIAWADHREFLQLKKEEAARIERQKEMEKKERELEQKQKELEEKERKLDRKKAELEIDKPAQIGEEKFPFNGETSDRVPEQGQINDLPAEKKLIKDFVFNVLDQIRYPILTQPESIEKMKNFKFASKTIRDDLLKFCASD